MRGANLILKRVVRLKDWEGYFKGNFENVRAMHSATLAKSESQQPGVINKLMIDDSHRHLDILDRPTTINEYEPEGIDSLKGFVGEPRQFLAIDYNDHELLRQVLAILLRHEGQRAIVVEDEDSKLTFIEDFLR